MSYPTATSMLAQRFDRQAVPRPVQMPFAALPGVRSRAGLDWAAFVLPFGLAAGHLVNEIDDVGTFEVAAVADLGGHRITCYCGIGVGLCIAAASLGCTVVGGASTGRSFVGFGIGRLVGKHRHIVSDPSCWASRDWIRMG